MATDPSLPTLYVLVRNVCQSCPPTQGLQCQALLVYLLGESYARTKSEKNAFSPHQPI